MNSQDGLCSSVETNCFTKENPSQSLFTSDFGFGKVLLIHSTMKSDLGKRYKIFGNTYNFFKVNKFVSQKELPGVASCTTTADYTDYYVEQYNPGKLGIQPHNFVIKDGEQINVESFRVWNPSNNFEWLKNQTNYTTHEERSYKSIKDDKQSTFVFKTNGADISIILRHDFIKPQKMHITSVLFVPYETQKLTKSINFETGIFYIFFTIQDFISSRGYI